MKQLSWVVLVAILAAACGNHPSKEIRQGSELLSVTFDQPGSWEVGIYPAGSQNPDSVLQIIDGRYQIDHRSDRSASFTWGTGGGIYENVTVEVETEQLSSDKDNLYGVGCRLAEGQNGDETGYLLLISGDGHYGIADFKNRSLTFLLGWHQSQTIRQGLARNTLRAVCVDDYLALYVNGKFMGETTDPTYRRGGQIGLIGGASPNHSIRVVFDNLKVYEGTISK